MTITKLNKGKLSLVWLLSCLSCYGWQIRFARSGFIKVGDSSLTVSIGMSIFDEPISFIDLFT
jgi:hypothetical protein